ncbi:5246_t:CDS:2, partial [Acaulospora colombiana]
MTEIPKIHVRWWHSTHGLAHMELLATPSAKISTQSWTKLTRDESDRCEAAWQELSEEEKRASIETSEPEEPSPSTGEDGEDPLILGVPIGKERLFEYSGSYPDLLSESKDLFGFDQLFDVHKNRPVDETLERQLEEAYRTIKPWKASYQEEVLAALQVGPAAYEKLKHPLNGQEGAIFFDDASTARLVYNSFANRVSSVLFGTLRGSRTNSPYPSASMIHRGYDEALRRTAPPSRPVSISPSRPASAHSELSPKEKTERRKSWDAKTVNTIATERGRRSTDFPAPDQDGTKAEDQNSRAKEEAFSPPDAKVGEGSSHDVTDLIL